MAARLPFEHGESRFGFIRGCYEKVLASGTRQRVHAYRAGSDNLSAEIEGLREGVAPTAFTVHALLPDSPAGIRIAFFRPEGTYNHMNSTKAVLMTILTAGIGLAAGHKLPQELQNIAPETSVDVIVQYRDQPTEVNHSRVSALGGELKRSLEIIRAAHYSISAGQLEALSQDPEVEAIWPDRKVFATWSLWGFGNTAIYTGLPDFGWRTVGADLAGSSFGVTGAGVGIAVIDSGVASHDDLKGGGLLGALTSRVVHSETLLAQGTTADQYGHGSHVAGIIAGNGTDSSGLLYNYTVRGIAPGANIISLKVLDGTGAGTDSVVIAAIQRAIALKSQYNIRVINLSLGRPVIESYQNDPLCLAVQQAWQAGIVVVVAAGNGGRDNSLGTNGYGTITAPGNSPYVITVGAMNTNGTLTPTDDKIASYSSKGPTSIDHIVKPDLVAPGNRVVSLRDVGSTLDTTYSTNQAATSVYSALGANVAGSYYVLSGTSMATPMVSGAAALMIQHNPSLTPDQVKARLMKTATKFAPGYTTATDPVTGVTYTDEFDIFTIGAGYLDIPAALGNTDVFTGSAMSPTAAFDPSTNSVYLEPSALMAVWGTGAVSANMAVWGTTTVWGSSVFVNGTMAVWGTGAVWGTMAVWGTSTPEACLAVWGTGAVWGASQTSSQANIVALAGDN
jgi:serine protease AprX